MIAKFYDQTRPESLLGRVSDFGFYEKVQAKLKRQERRQKNASNIAHNSSLERADASAIGSQSE